MRDGRSTHSIMLFGLAGSVMGVVGEHRCGNGTIRRESILCSTPMLYLYTPAVWQCTGGLITHYQSLQHTHAPPPIATGGPASLLITLVWFDSSCYHLCQFRFPPLCITSSVIKGQFLSCHVSMMCVVKDTLSQ